MRKIIFLFIIFIFIISFSSSYADDYLEIYSDEVTEVSTSSNKEPITSSKNIAIIDKNTNLLIYQKNANERVKMASTTKIMTCILAIENSSNLNETVTISKKASRIRGSILGLNYNDTFTLNDLLYGLMLHSGNDAAIAIAEHIGGTEEHFIEMMNNKAIELGLYNTHFTSPHGLDNDEHYTTAYELSILSSYALKNDIFCKIVNTKNYSFSKFNFRNTNELLGNYPGVYGIKTGFTAEAGRCLVTACKRNDIDLICVVLGAGTKSQRTIDTKNMLNYIFSNYEYHNFNIDISNFFTKYINNYQNSCNLYKTTTLPQISYQHPANTNLLINKNLPPNINFKTFSTFTLSPSYKSNSIIGKLYIYNNENLLFNIDILLSTNLTISSYCYNLKKLIHNLFTF